MPASESLENSVTRKSKQWLRVLLFLPLSLLLLYLAFRNTSLDELWKFIGEANIWWVVAAMLCGWLSYVIRALRWQLQLNALGHSLTFMPIFYALNVGYFVNLLLPRAGEVARCAQLAHSTPVHFDQAIGTVVVDRLADLLVFMIIGIVAVLIGIDRFGAFLFNDLLGPFFARITPRSWIFMATGGLITILTLLILWKAIARGKLGRKVKEKSINFMRGIREGVISVWYMRAKGLFLLYTALLWTTYWLMTYIIGLALPFTAHMGMSTAFLLLVVGTFGMTVPAQGGFGSFHIVVALWLQVEGFTKEEGLAYATLSHSTQLIALLILTVSLVIWRISVRKGLRNR